MNQSNLFNKGWRRHSIISQNNGGVEAIKPLLPEIIQTLLERPGAIAIVATYDCAVVHADYEKEPWVQLLVASPVSCKKKYTLCRNPRKLHFQITIHQAEENHEVTAAGICQIRRQALQDIKPDKSYKLQGLAVDNINYWIAERFRQVAWPDAFNRALAPQTPKIKKFYNKYSDYISAVYIQLDRYDEIKEGEKYQLSIIIAISKSKYRPLIEWLREAEAQLKNSPIDELKEFIEGKLISVIGNNIELLKDPTKSHKKAVEVLSEDGITLDQIRMYFRYSPYTESAGSADSIKPVDAIPSKT